MNEENTSWQYKPDGQKTVPEPRLDGRPPAKSPSQRSAPNSIEWTASEYIEHARGSSWYIVLTIGTVGLAALVYILTKDFFAGAITLILGIIIGIFTMHKPKEMTYRLSSDGFTAGDKQYTFSQFKSFAVIREAGLYSLNLVPIKKFMPIISAYFAAKDEEKIVNLLGQYLAYEERGLDTIERLTRRLRF